VVPAFYNMQGINISLIFQVHEVIEKEEFPRFPVDNQGRVGSGLSKFMVHDGFQVGPRHTAIAAAASDDIYVLIAAQVGAGRDAFIHDSNQVPVDSGDQCRNAVTGHAVPHGSIEKVLTGDKSRGENRCFFQSGSVHGGYAYADINQFEHDGSSLTVRVGHYR